MPAAAQAVSRSSAVGTAWRGLPPEEQAARLREAWDELDADGRFLLVKLIGGGFRVGVSKLLVQRALAEQAGLDGKVIAQRLMGWTDARASVSAERFTQLIAPTRDAAFDAGQPYPRTQRPGAAPHPRAG